MTVPAARGKRRDTFAAIADPTRRRILGLLREHDSLTAGEIAGTFATATRPGISRHLRVLRESKLVEVTKQGRERRYELNARPLAELRDGWLAQFARSHTTSLAKLRRLAEAGPG